jgi:hypothetical protein
VKCWKIFGLENIFFCHLGISLLKELCSSYRWLTFAFV